VKNAVMDSIIEKFEKWYGKIDTTGIYTNEEAKARDRYGFLKSGDDRMVAFFSGYKAGYKAAKSDQRK
jgi:hypothetical protein